MVAQAAWVYRQLCLVNCQLWHVYWRLSEKYWQVEEKWKVGGN